MKLHNVLMLTGVILLGVGCSALLSGGTSQTTETSQDTQSDYNTLALERFADIESAWKESGDELESIECPEDNCNSVVYFNFNEVPEDLSFSIRANTATFSKFKLDTKGVSHVTVAAKVDGIIVFQCNGKKGAVTECK